MSEEDIDAVDEDILYALQEDARNMSSGDIAERTSASDSTVRKRIQRLQADGVTKGYTAEVDYRKSGYPLRMLLFCTAAIPDRGDHVPTSWTSTASSPSRSWSPASRTSS